MKQLFDEFDFIFFLFEFYQDVGQGVCCRVLNLAKGILAKLEKQRHNLGVNSLGVEELGELT